MAVPKVEPRQPIGCFLCVKTIKGSSKNGTKRGGVSQTELSKSVDLSMI